MACPTSARIAVLLVRLAVHQVPLLDEKGDAFEVLAWLKEHGEGQQAAA
jgi:hypothetical protein